MTCTTLHFLSGFKDDVSGSFGVTQQSIQGRVGRQHRSSPAPTLNVDSHCHYFPLRHLELAQSQRPTFDDRKQK